MIDPVVVAERRDEAVKNALIQLKRPNKTAALNGAVGILQACVDIEEVERQEALDNYAREIDALLEGGSDGFSEVC